MQYKKISALLLALALCLSPAVPAAAYDSARADASQTLSGGSGGSFFIDDSGDLWAWGSNEWGQLGDGTTTDRTRPVRVLDNVRSVSAGDCHTYAVREDDTLWAWGRNVSNSFPDSDIGSSPTPVKIMDDVRMASTGTLTHLAVKTDGSLWTWGRYVGDRTNKQRSSPTRIMEYVAAATTGYGHSLALKTDGSLWAWGQNIYGGAGSSTGTQRPTPTKVMDDVVSMSAGYGFSAAVKRDGSLWTWGSNGQGELGDGTVWVWDITWEWNSPDPEEDAVLQESLASWIERWGPKVNRDHSIPTRIMDQVSGVYAANNNCYALRNDGSLWAWGSNVYGAVGDSTVTDRLSPVKVMDGVTEVGVGWNHVLVKTDGGALWAWGGNLGGQLGSGESGFYNKRLFLPRFSSSPLRVADISGGDLVSLPASDIAGYTPAPWAQDAYDKANELGFLPRGLCTPIYDLTITRGEFCALAVQFYEAFTGRQIDKRASFTDTSDDSIEKAAGLGVVSGAGDGTFSPGDPLSREQAAVILTNLARALNAPLPRAQHTFADEDISLWAQDAIGQVQGAGVMSGTGGGLFSPQETYTREQSVVTIMNLYRLVSKA